MTKWNWLSWFTKQIFQDSPSGFEITWNKETEKGFTSNVENGEEDQAFSLAVVRCFCDMSGWKDIPTLLKGNLY